MKCEKGDGAEKIESRSLEDIATSFFSVRVLTTLAYEKCAGCKQRTKREYD